MVMVAIIKLAPEHKNLFFYETISTYKMEFQETKALFGANESEESETLQGAAASCGKLTKVEKC